MPQAFWRGVGTSRDTRIKHDSFDKLPAAAAREPPESRAAVFKAVHLMDHAEEFSRDRNLAEYDGALTFLERSDRDESSVTLDRTRGKRKRLGDPAAGISQRQA